MSGDTDATDQPLAGNTSSNTNLEQTGEGHRERTTDNELETPLWQHPLVGLVPRRTAVTALILGIFTLLFTMSALGGAVTVDGQPLDTTTGLFDSLSAWVIAIATALIVAGPFLYAAWNGGPTLAAAIPLVPVALGELVTGRYAFGLDWAIALTTSVAGGVFAVYVLDVREAGSLRPWDVSTDTPDRLLALTVFTLVGAIAVGRFVLAAPETLPTAYLPFALLWLVPMTLVTRYWVARVRTHGRTAESSSVQS
ncbi:hypothetical protein [Natronosalvus amylolyticus]|uniref:hypothetical protein n=1 Tax=Natronosalvus amylolyticus TaxID=2961994 RepID=UPI0020C94C18|nr:hypothetical protein [Natronosalvus amylolyticus]